MTWESQGPPASQDPRAPGPYQPQGPVPPPGYPPQGPVPPHPPGERPPFAIPQADPWANPPLPPPPLYPPPGSPYGAPPPEPLWQPPPAFPLAPDAYPVNISYDRDARINRAWGIPIMGQAIRWILLLPHLVVLALLSIMAALQFLVTWIAILVLGRYPGWGYRWTGGLMAYWQRVLAYGNLMTPAYPPFALEAEMHPLSIRFDEGVRINRAWGLPIIGYAVRALILIPHFIVLAIVGVVAGFLVAFAWLPVLLLGRQADLIYTIVGGFYRWGLRVSAYFLMMVDRYPPFSLGEDDPRL